MSRTCGKLAGLSALLIAISTTVPGVAATLDRIGHDKTIRIAYRNDAPPFSYKNDKGDPAGFIVDLCRAVARQLGQQTNQPDLKIAYVAVTAADRFAAITDGKADLLCEPTTETLSRRKQVDFSIPTFVDGASLLIRSDGPQSLKALAGQKIGVLAGTTTEQELRNTLDDAKITAEVVPAKTHEDGLQMLDDGKISAYFADRGILEFLVQKSKDPEKLLLAENYLTVEPYALALPYGDEAFRLAVDTALSHIYRSGEIDKIFTQTFGGKTKPSRAVEMLYMVSGLPD